MKQPHSNTNNSLTKLQRTMQLGLSVVVAMVIALYMPLAALAAEETTAATSTPSTQAEITTTPSEPQPSTGPTNPTGPTKDPGPQKPTGATASTFSLNKDTGMWENDYYIWDPATGQSRPKSVPDYFFDPATGTWSSQQWTYDPTTGKYEATPVVLSKQAADSLGLSQPSNNASINTTGPSSNNQINATNNTNGFFNLFSRAEVANYFNMNALSGDSAVDSNTIAGDAESGDASSIANILNLLRSAWNVSGGQLMSFVKDIYGDLNGDILLNLPAPDTSSEVDTSSHSNSIGNTGSDSNNTINAANNGDLTVNATNLNTITNNLDLSARSGDANVTGNTQAGSARTGNAKVLLNLLNLIGSAIAARQSFFGVLNVHGNFTGDVLLPTGFLDSLIASNAGTSAGVSNSINNTGSNSNNQITEDHDKYLTSNTQNIDTIANNITTNAQSGDAEVSRNTKAGSAKTGDATSNLTLLNLTGHNVVAENAVLVFVNVFGKWVGLIMDAPQGATSAVLGGNVSSNTLNPSLPEGSTTLNNTNQNTITNNLNLSARSGDASVTDNTTAGDAKSGDAKIAANVGNIIDSTFGLSKFFGVFIINVFGDWFGSFGVDTPYGNQPITTQQETNTSSSNSVTNTYSSTGAIGGQLTSIAESINQSGQQTTIAAGSTSHDEPTQSSKTTTATNNPYLIPFISVVALLIAAMLYRVSRKQN